MSVTNLEYNVTTSFPEQSHPVVEHFFLNRKVCILLRPFAHQWVKGVSIVALVFVGVLGAASGGMIVVTSASTFPAFLASLQIIGGAGLIGSTCSFTVGGVSFAAAASWILYLVVKHYQKANFPKLSESDAKLVASSLKPGQFFVYASESGTLYRYEHTEGQVRKTPLYPQMDSEEVEKAKTELLEKQKGAFIYQLKQHPTAYYSSEGDLITIPMEKIEVLDIDLRLYRMLETQSNALLLVGDHYFFASSASGLGIEGSEGFIIKFAQEDADLSTIMGKILASEGEFIHAQFGENIYKFIREEGEIRRQPPDDPSSQSDFLNLDRIETISLAKSGDFRFYRYAGKFYYVVNQNDTIEEHEMSVEVDIPEGKEAFICSESQKLFIVKYNRSTNQVEQIPVPRFAHRNARLMAKEGKSIHYIREEDGKVYRLEKQDGIIKETPFIADARRVTKKNGTSHAKYLKRLHQSPVHIDPMQTIKQMRAFQKQINIQRALCEETLEKIEKQQARIKKLFECRVLLEDEMFDFAGQAQKVFNNCFVPNQDAPQNRVQAAKAATDTLKGILTEVEKFVRTHCGPLEILARTNFKVNNVDNPDQFNFLLEIIIKYELYPKYLSDKDLGGQVVYFSEVFQISDRIGVIAYVEGEKGVFVPHILYNKKGDVHWKAALASSDYYETETYDQELKSVEHMGHLALDVVDFLKTLLENKNTKSYMDIPQIRGTDFNVLANAIVPQHQAFTLLERALHLDKISAFSQKLMRLTTVQYRSETQFVSFSGKKEDMPDLRDEAVKVLKVEGDTTIWQIPSLNNRYLYVIERVKNRGSWIEQDDVKIFVYNKECEATTLLTCKKVVRLKKYQEQMLIDYLKKSSSLDIKRENDEAHIVPIKEIPFLASNLDEKKYFLAKASRDDKAGAYAAVTLPPQKDTSYECLDNVSFQALVNNTNAKFPLLTKEEIESLSVFLEIGDILIYHIKGKKDPKPAEHQHIRAWVAKKYDGVVKHYAFSECGYMRDKIVTIEDLRRKAQEAKNEIARLGTGRIPVLSDDKAFYYIANKPAGTYLVFQNGHEQGKNKAVLRITDKKSEIVDLDQIYPKCIANKVAPVAYKKDDSSDEDD